ncbi:MULTISPECIES: peptide chain release factor N(5)-glutamine methyltransferase [unclassified Luteococcus]|uniref:peptide chain release factor N(5)-glutamine methyltransferase n=1 Tax=unclassified Luteococcus TaxID=2639923 RepID=UPI00313D92D1
MTRTPVRELLRRGTADLARAGSPSPAAEARTLLSHVMGTEPGRLVLAPDATAEQAEHFQHLVARRTTGIPVQHLTGEAWFRTVRLAVGPGVFVPRPETEVMTGWALERLAGLPEPVVVELCAGSGAISKAIAAEHPGARQYAVELDETAHDWARRNLADTGVELRQGDMADAFRDLDGTADLVIANPPYIPLDAWESVTAEVRDHDPALALWSGDDGLDATRVVAAVAARLLRPGGWACSEHAEVQHHSAPEVFVQTGAFGQVRDLPDLTGRPRFVTAQRSGSGVAGCTGE